MWNSAGAVTMGVCRLCVQETGGLVVMADSFGQSVFKESFRRVFARYPAELRRHRSGS